MPISQTILDYAAFARTIGFILLLVLICFTAIVMRQYRYVWASIVLWAFFIVANFIIRQLGELDASNLVLVFVITPMEWIVVFAIGLGIWQWLKKKESEGEK